MSSKRVGESGTKQQKQRGWEKRRVDRGWWGSGGFGVLTGTGCMDSVREASAEQCVILGGLPWRSECFLACWWWVCERSELDGHCSHCPDMAEQSFSLNDQVLRPDRWPARSVFVCVYVNVPHAALNILLFMRPGVNNKRDDIQLRLKIWKYYFTYFRHLSTLDTTLENTHYHTCIKGPYCCTCVFVFPKILTERQSPPWESPVKSWRNLTFNFSWVHAPPPLVFLCRVNPQSVVFIALSWWVLVTMWSSCCECKSTPAYNHLWQNAVKEKQSERERESEKKRDMLFTCSYVFYCCSSCDSSVTEQQQQCQETLSIHTLYIPEMNWQTHTFSHQPAVSPTAAAPQALKYQRRRSRESQAWEW